MQFITYCILKFSFWLFIWDFYMNNLLWIWKSISWTSEVWHVIYNVDNELNILTQLMKSSIYSVLLSLFGSYLLILLPFSSKIRTPNYVYSIVKFKISFKKKFKIDLLTQIKTIFKLCENVDVCCFFFFGVLQYIIK